MKEFEQKSLFGWDYMWRNKEGKKVVGALLFPSQRKKEGRYLWEIKKRIINAYKSQDYVSMTILYHDSFLDLDARVWTIEEKSGKIIVKDAAGEFYHIRMSDVLHIDKQHDERTNE
ncbi:hypothetical protein P6P90_07105 [Ectobacillus antri]|uniref:Uncharacterized protein n=1 Tax=Ectobacillus antri TaxID=2486280 RepID=A0ABT6H4U1_9BACI|nr:hypothetical protein [Ectobacillus antri]MDG4658405.1 hypothetical protein [Ectobacillus antri]MDG5753739.1 hypothetical protein [Ectobacillus antri]